MLSRVAVVMLGVWALVMADVAHATPYFEVVGGTLATQGSVPLGNVIPLGAKGFENRQTIQGDDSSKNPITIYLRDTSAADGTAWTITVDYVGSDAMFTNEFSAGGGAVEWCNQTTGCTSGFSALGAGNDDWFGNYKASGSFTGTVGDPIDFTFFAELISGTPQHAFGNGDSIFSAHMGVFNIQGEVFNTLDWDRTGTAFAVGLTDGEFSQLDDDHQDLMVRFTVVPEPGTMPLLLGGLLFLGSMRRRARGSSGSC
jgi:hypothetical protein